MKDLTASQKDYAIFLPATSNFYASFIGKQRYENYVDPARIPPSYKSGVESLNFLDPERGQFYYKWCLYSAGHADLNLSTFNASEDMFRNRDRSSSWVLGDSGGFQIGKGVWEADWKNPNCPAALKKRQQVLTWMDSLMDYGMTLDIPAWTARIPAGRKASGINTYMDAVQATYINNDFFIKNRNGNCKFLNVLQGENHTHAEDWYQRMRQYCDHSIYGDNAFNGWAFGGQHTRCAHLSLKRLVALIYDGLLEENVHDWVHFLGISRLEWAVFFTDIQRAIRKNHNPNFTISYDCASPFLATANGMIYTITTTNHDSKWSYRMEPVADDKKYATDHRLFKDAVVQDGLVPAFHSGPMIDDVKIKDVCIYAHGIPDWNAVNQDHIDHDLLFKTPALMNDPKYWIKMGDLNKINKVGATSWDSFSYGIQMGHNIWAHIDAVQVANQNYDSGSIPRMLMGNRLIGRTFRDAVDIIFSAPSRGFAEKQIEEFDRFWSDIIGTKGNTGKRTKNPISVFNELFEEVDDVDVADDVVLDEDKLEELEEAV